MLDRLDEVDWSSLTHAYGPAADVPDRIRELRSPDREVRRRAIRELYGNIYHQGTRFEASAPAVPFLLEVAADASTPDRHRVIRLLADLAIGQAHFHASTGFPIEALRADVAETALAVLDDLQRQTKAWLATFDGGQWRSPLSTVERRQVEWWHELRAYEAVGAGVPLLTVLIADADVEIALAAIFAVAWFPERSADAVPGLVRIAADDGQSSSRISAALVAIGLLMPPTAPELDELLRARLRHDDSEIRWAAAVALAHLAADSIPPDALDELWSWAARYGSDETSTMWEVSREELALQLLDLSAVELAQQIRSELVAVELARPPKSNWNNHFNVVLDRAFPAAERGHERAFAELAPAQRAVVSWLIEHPEVFRSSGPAHPLRQHRLPTTHAALAAYAGLSG